MGYVPIFSKIIRSSLWDETDAVCKVFITLLAMMDYDYVVRETTYAIARESRKSEEEAAEALRILSEPDTRRHEEQPHDGRRILKRDDGWFIINGDKYQKMMRQANRRAYMRDWMRNYRDRIKSGLPIAGEKEYRAAMARGAGEDELNRIITSHLPTASERKESE